MKYTKLESILEEIVARWGIPGLGIGIVDRGEISYARGFGVQSLETQVPVNPDSIFCLASIGKCFVATAVMQLVEAGKLELDLPLIRYLPYFQLADDRYQKITIRQILSHTSGMPDLAEDEYDDLVSHPEYDISAAERFVRAQSNRKMIAAPGERFAYSNIAYNVLGDLISKSAGQTFEDYMQEHILYPAGMPDSTFNFRDLSQARLAMPHLRTPGMIVNPIDPYHRADAPSSFLHSSVVEMCHWAITCLNRGGYKDQRILTPASYDLMWTPVVNRDYPPFREEMGLGWTLGHFDGDRTIGHGGGGFGWTCFLALLPENNRAAIVLCNEESMGHERALDAVLCTLIEKEPQVGTISWMIPIAQSLQIGGIRAAYARYEEIKDSDEYFFDEYELITLVYQLVSVKNIDLAIDVLELNLHVFPEHLGSFIILAKAYLQKGDRTRAKEILQKALALAPKSVTIAELLEKAE
jgi:CubicO group peptidase (beta-lactamase class C family)